MKAFFLSLMLLIAQLAIAQQRPNIIVLLADDLGYGDLGSYNQQLIQTPNIDALAKEGLIFTDFYAGAPVCGPSRSVLITGQHTGHTTVRGNNTITGGTAGKKGDKVVYRANLSNEDFTIGHLMQNAGYHTAIVGKWHLGGYDSTATPLHRGFDHFSGWLINRPETYASTYWPDKRFVNGDMVTILANANNKKRYYHTHMCTDEAKSYLNKRKDNEAPFLLMVNYSNPHAPLDAPANSPYDDRPWPENMRIYANMIHHLDQSVGAIKQHLKETGFDENTIIFFCSDNGPRSNYSDHLTEVVDFFDSNGPLRGYKRDLYEGGIRTPMIVWAPKMITANTKNDAPGYFADLMPTFAAIANTEQQFSSDGANILPLILGQTNSIGDRFIYWEFHERGFRQAVRYGQWKAVIQNGKMEIYDLKSDLSETTDISAENPEIVKLFENYLSTCRTESPFWPVE